MDSNYYDNNELDINKFNELYKKGEIEKNRVKDEERENNLKSLETNNNKKSINELSINEIVDNFKNENFDLIYDLFTFNYSSKNDFYNLFTKNNRLFYFGLLILIICIIFYIFILVFSESYDININIPRDYNISYKNTKIEKNNDIKNLRKELNKLSSKFTKLDIKREKIIKEVTKKN